MGRFESEQRKLDFEVFLKAPAQGESRPGCRDPRGRLCQLCLGHRLDYPSECRLKEKALKKWSSQFRELGSVEFLAVEPGRHYRSVSKRRWSASARQLQMVESVQRGRVRGIAPLDCAIEPAEHGQVYRYLQESLLTSKVAPVLNYAVVKSDPESTILLLNVTDVQHFRADLNRLSKRMTRNCPGLTGIWVLSGSKGDDYYFNIDPARSQRLFGQQFLKSPQNLEYSPLCFTQVNPQAADAMLAWTRTQLNPSPLPLYDFYSGYGLFSLGLDWPGPTRGFEVSSEAVSWARRNARRLGRKQSRFETRDLSRELPESIFPEGNWVALLDPPRGGAPPSLIASLARRRPRRVVHWICDLGVVEGQLRAWREAGYGVRQAVAVDMFAGSQNLELGLLLQPGRPARKAKPASQPSKAGDSRSCKPPHMPVNSPATSTEPGARRNPRGRSKT